MPPLCQPIFQHSFNTLARAVETQITLRPQQWHHPPSHDVGESDNSQKMDSDENVISVR
jgi:hypothetical protein